MYLSMHLHMYVCMYIYLSDYVSCAHICQLSLSISKLLGHQASQAARGGEYLHHRIRHRLQEIVVTVNHVIHLGVGGEVGVGLSECVSE